LLIYAWKQTEAPDRHREDQPPWIQTHGENGIARARHPTTGAEHPLANTPAADIETETAKDTDRHGDTAEVEVEAEAKGDRNGIDPHILAVRRAEKLFLKACRQTSVKKTLATTLYSSEHRFPPFSCSLHPFVGHRAKF
jgi:hypothetical protein